MMSLDPEHGACHRASCLCQVDLILCITNKPLTTNHSLQRGEESINYIIGIIELDPSLDKLFPDSDRPFGRMNANFLNP